MNRLFVLLRPGTPTLTRGRSERASGGGVRVRHPACLTENLRSASFRGRPSDEPDVSEVGLHRILEHLVDPLVPFQLTYVCDRHPAGL